MSLTKNSYPLDVNQCPHQTTQYKFMMHYVKSGNTSENYHLNRTGVCVTTHLLLSVAYPGILFVGVQKIQLRTENVDLGAVAP